MTGSFQPMPDLSDEQFDALKADIAAHGVLTPVVKDQHGRIIDGNHRAAIATELGIDYPERVVEVADDAEAMTLAVTLNCARRHLTREQVRTVMGDEIRRRPDDSDRAIARRVGCSPTTVGTVRAELAERDKPNIADELRRCPYDSDRDIASRIRCSPTVVVAVRAELAPSIVLNELRLHRSDSDSDIASRIRCDQGIVVSVRAMLDEKDDRAFYRQLEEHRGRIAMRAVIAHRAGMPLQTVGDVIERMMWAEVSKLDTDLGDTDVWGPLFGVMFDEIRAYECPADCTVCVPAYRQWRDAHPQQVYRWPDPPEVSKLDTEPAEVGDAG